MRRYLLPLLLAAAGLPACNHVDFGPDPGIAYRDASNQPMGGDDTDWHADQRWTATEQKLFADLPFSVRDGGAGGLRSIGFFPNPVSTTARQGSFYVDMRATGPLQLRLVAVDRRYRRRLTLNETATPGSYGNYLLNLHLPAEQFKAGERYRLYYVFYDAAGLRYKGHGDILLKDQ